MSIESSLAKSTGITKSTDGLQSRVNIEDRKILVLSGNIYVVFFWGGGGGVESNNFFFFFAPGLDRDLDSSACNKAEYIYLKMSKELCTCIAKNGRFLSSYVKFFVSIRNRIQISYSES
jgi:hypothetical protein